MKKQNGITLIALVISIIVMLILAGISINAVVSEDGVISKAMHSTLVNKFASYMENANMNYVNEFIESTVNKEKTAPPTVLGDYVKNYITNLEEQDVGKFVLIGGEFYYVGDNKNELEACMDLGIKVKPENVSTDEYILTLESDALVALMRYQNGKAFTSIDEDSGDSVELGIKLWDKNLGNANRWKIISEITDNKVVATYGTGWYYVPAGAMIDGIGKLKKDYIINYDTNKAVLFDSSKHTMLSYETTLGVSQNLIFNLDPGVIENINNSNLSETEKQEKINEMLGTNVELCNMDFSDDNTGITSSEFKFDGENDAIRVIYNSDEEKNNIINNGLTFEFYGIFNDGKIQWIKSDGLNKEGEPLPTLTESHRAGRNGILMYTLYNAEQTYLEHYYDPEVDQSTMTEEEKQEYLKETRKESLDFNAIRFTLVSNGSNVEQLLWNCGKGNYDITESHPDYELYKSDYSQDGHLFNQYTPVELKNGEPVYLTFTLTPNENYIKDGKEMLKYKIYLNGEKVIEAGYNKKQWDAFITDCLPYIGEFHIGRTIYNSAQYFYSKLNCYTTRLYSKALTETEILLNYKNSVAYHEYLVNETSGGTSGNVSGEDINDIN